MPARELTKIALTAFYTFFVSYAGWNTVFNYEQDDIATSPFYFRAAQASVVVFSFGAAATIRKELQGEDAFGTEFITGLSGLTYTILTLIGIFVPDVADKVESTETFQHMRASITIPLQAAVASRIALEVFYLLTAIGRALYRGTKAQRAQVRGTKEHVGRSASTSSPSPRVDLE